LAVSRSFASDLIHDPRQTLHHERLIREKLAPLAERDVVASHDLVGAPHRQIAARHDLVAARHDLVAALHVRV
jgi:hypothetical protein